MVLLWGPLNVGLTSAHLHLPNGLEPCRLDCTRLGQLEAVSVVQIGVVCSTALLRLGAARARLCLARRCHRPVARRDFTAPTSITCRNTGLPDRAVETRQVELHSPDLLSIDRVPSDDWESSQRQVDTTDGWLFCKLV